MAAQPADDVTAEDVAELNRLVTECKRPRVKLMLDAYLAQLQSPSSSSTPKPALPAAAAPGASATCIPPSAPVRSKVAAPEGVATPSPPAPAFLSSAPAAEASGAEKSYVPISTFGWDQDSFGKEPNNVYIYLMTGFEGIGEFKEGVGCTFDKQASSACRCLVLFHFARHLPAFLFSSKMFLLLAAGASPENRSLTALSPVDNVSVCADRQAFDLKIHGFKGKNYRLVKSNLVKASRAVHMPPSSLAHACTASQPRARMLRAP